MVVHPVAALSSADQARCRGPQPERTAHRCRVEELDVPGYETEELGRSILESACDVEQGPGGPHGLHLIVGVREELRERVRHTLDLLKPADREILWMVNFDQLSYADIAAVLGITENTAYQRYHRALGRLSDLWLKLYPESSASS